MEFERKRYNHVYMNVAPLVDVVFLLLLFFMLASHLVQEPSISLTLPESETAEIKELKGLEIVIKRDGETFLNGEPVSLEQLGGLLEGRRDESLTIKADRDLRLGLMIKVVDQVRKAGINEFSIVTDFHQ
jgi:biopolymer transport protein ExbD